MPSVHWMTEQITTDPKEVLVVLREVRVERNRDDLECSSDL